MSAYVAIIEEAGPDLAVGVWFPDLPGCVTAGDDAEDALRNASEVLVLYAEALADEGKALPAARRLSELRRDPEIASDLRDHMVALIPFPATAVAAERSSKRPR